MLRFPPAFENQSLTGPACCAGALTWPALSRWKGSQGLPRLTALAGSAQVEVMTSETDTFHGELRRHSPTTCKFAEFLQAAAPTRDSPRGAATASFAAPAGGDTGDTGWPAEAPAVAGSAGAFPPAASGLQASANMLWPGKAGQPAAQSKSSAETAALPQSSLPPEATSLEPGGGNARPGRQRPARASAELPRPHKRAKTRTAAPNSGASQLAQELLRDSPEPGGENARPGRQRPARASAELPEPCKRAKTGTAPGISASQLQQESLGDITRNGRSGAQPAATRFTKPSSQQGNHLHDDSSSSSSGPSSADWSAQATAAHDQATLGGHIAAAGVVQAQGGQQSRLGPHLYLAQATISRCNSSTDKASGLNGLWQDFSVPRALEGVQVSQTNLWMSLRWEPKTLREQQAALPYAWCRIAAWQSATPRLVAWQPACLPPSRGRVWQSKDYCCVESSMLQPALTGMDCRRKQNAATACVGTRDPSFCTAVGCCLTFALR